MTDKQIRAIYSCYEEVMRILMFDIKESPSQKQIDTVEGIQDTIILMMKRGV